VLITRDLALAPFADLLKHAVEEPQVQDSDLSYRFCHWDLAGALATGGVYAWVVFRG
jgi:hypothetical protein